MKYRLDWINTWSEQREATDPRVIVQYEEQPDGWFEHYYHYYTYQDNDEQARQAAMDFIENSGEDIEVFSLLDENDKVIMTEEDL